VAGAVSTCHSQRIFNLQCKTVSTRYIKKSESKICRNQQHQTCHGKKTGVISSGTRIGMTMTSSKISPSIRGIRPIRISATNNDFDTCNHTSTQQIQHISLPSISHKADKSLPIYLSKLVIK